jgi:hypothetical protein
MLDQRVGSYGVLEEQEAGDELDVKFEELTRLGYTLVESGVDEATLVELRAKLGDVYEQQGRELVGISLADSPDADVARCLLAYEKAFFHLAVNEALLGFCQRVFGPNFTLLQQNGVINRPSDANYQQQWHRDLQYQHWVASEPIAIAALFCLDEFNATTGGTYVLPASQLHESFPSQDFVRRHQEVMTAPPGTFIVMDAMVYHRAGKNTSGNVRRAVNHLVGRPFMSQQIDMPGILGPAYREDPVLSGYLGYKWRPTSSVKEWREGKFGSST